MGKLKYLIGYWLPISGDFVLSSQNLWQSLYLELNIGIILVSK